MSHFSIKCPAFLICKMEILLTTSLRIERCKITHNGSTTNVTSHCLSLLKFQIPCCTKMVFQQVEENGPPFCIYLLVLDHHLHVCPFPHPRDAVGLGGTLSYLWGSWSEWHLATLKKEIAQMGKTEMNCLTPSQGWAGG